MQQHNGGQVRYYSFDCYTNFPVVHGIFTRQGGVSPEPWASLNQGGTVGDERRNVIENRRIAFDVFNRKVESIFDVWQVHGAEVIASNEPRPLDAPHPKADAILTNRAEITLFMRFADCVPVLFLDPVQYVIGIAHAGWQGTVKNVVGATVRKMMAEYGTHPEDIHAAIGPSIGPHHYPVREEVVSEVHRHFGERASETLSRGNGQYHFDLWEANKINLEQAGVRQIEIAGICTACNLHEWYSHRGEHGKTGRFGVLIALSREKPRG